MSPLVDIARHVAHRVVDKARETEAGRAALQAATLIAGVPYVSKASSSRESLERLEHVVATARRMRGDAK